MLQPSDSLKTFVFSNYGFSTVALYGIEQRFEMNKKTIFINNSDDLWINIFKKRFSSLLLLFTKFIPEHLALKTIFKINVVILHLLKTYKGYRHLQGLPANGQRTWSNSWSSFRSNNTLRNFKLEMAKKFYGNISFTDIKIAFLAEQTNLLWKQQWYQIWKKTGTSRDSKLGKRKSKKIIKPDLMLMSKGQVFLPLMKKDLTKKQKTKFDQSAFACGYRTGFTKILLKDLLKNISAHTAKNISKISLLTPVTKRKKIKKKTIDIKAKKAKHKLKKQKKKSVWD